MLIFPLNDAFSAQLAALSKSLNQWLKADR